MSRTAAAFVSCNSDLYLVLAKNVKEPLDAFDSVATLVTTVDGSPWILQAYFEAKCSRVKAVLDKILIPQHIYWLAFN